MAKHILSTDWTKKVILFSTEARSTSDLLKAFSAYSSIRRGLLFKLKKNNSLVEVKISKLIKINISEKEKHIMHLYWEEKIPDEVLKEFAQTDNIGINFKPIINREFVTSDGKVGLISLGETLQQGPYAYRFNNTKKVRNYINSRDYINIPPGRYQVSIYPLALSNEEIVYKRAHAVLAIKTETESKFGINSYEKVLKRRKFQSKLLEFGWRVLFICVLLQLSSSFLPVYKSYLNLTSTILFVILVLMALLILYFDYKKTIQEKFVEHQENNMLHENFPTMLVTMHRISD